MIPIGIAVGSLFSLIQLMAFRGSMMLMTKDSKQSLGRVIFQYILAFLVVFVVMAIAIHIELRLFIGIAIGISSFSLIIVFMGILGKIKHS